MKNSKRSSVVSLINTGAPILTVEPSVSLLNRMLCNIEPSEEATAVIVLHIPIKKRNLSSLLRMIRDAGEL